MSILPLPYLSESSNVSGYHSSTIAIPTHISTRRTRLLPRTHCDLSNLIIIKTLPPVPHRHATKFLFRYINALSIKNKSSYFLDHVAEHNPDIVGITETWLTSKDAAARAECTPTGYKLLHQDRPASRRGGGLALLIRDGFRTKRNSTNIYSSFEVADWTLSINNQRLRVIVVYRPPYSEKHPVTISFIDEFSSFLESVVICNEPMIITGNFNINVDVPSESKQFSELLDCTSLVQHIHDPTH